MKLKYLLIVVLFVAMPGIVPAQSDIHFSQFYETSMLRNPALTGVYSPTTIRLVPIIAASGAASPILTRPCR